MLQTNRLQSDNELPEGLAQSGEGGGIGSIINFVLGFLRRRYLWIIVSAVIAIAACVVYLRDHAADLYGAGSDSFGGSPTIRKAAVACGSRVRSRPDGNAAPNNKIKGDSGRRYQAAQA